LPQSDHAGDESFTVHGMNLKVEISLSDENNILSNYSLLKKKN